MTNYLTYPQLVENLCITACKSLRIIRENLCVFLHPFTTTCGFPHFRTHFSSLSHLLLHSRFTPTHYQSFPLFHPPYYYYYKYILIIIK